MTNKEYKYLQNSNCSHTGTDNFEHRLHGARVHLPIYLLESQTPSKDPTLSSPTIILMPT